MNPFELELQLSQNVLDFLAAQIKAWADFIGGGDDDNNEDVQISENTFIVGKGLGTVSTNRLNGSWTRGIFGCDFVLTPATKSNYVQNIHVYQGLLDGENTEVITNFLLNRLSFDASNAQGFYWANSDSFLMSRPAVTVHAWTDFTNIPRSTSHILVNYTPFNESAGKGNYFGVQTIDYNEFYPYLLTGSPVFQNAVNRGGELTTENINNKNFSYSYNDSYGYYFDLPDTFSYNEFKMFVDKAIDTTFPDNSITFPPYSEVPFAYIEPIHQLDYSLQMPDTSDYLDVQAISKPLSICSDSLAYFWNAITSFGLAPVLGFCLVATLIIKGLRGD